MERTAEPKPPILITIELRFVGEGRAEFVQAAQDTGVKITSAARDFPDVAGVQGGPHYSSQGRSIALRFWLSSVSPSQADETVDQLLARAGFTRAGSDGEPVETNGQFETGTREFLMG